MAKSDTYFNTMLISVATLLILNQSKEKEILGIDIKHLKLIAAISAGISSVAVLNSEFKIFKQ